MAPGDYISGGFANSDQIMVICLGHLWPLLWLLVLLQFLHDHWGHLKGNPKATAAILFESAIDKGAPGVDKVYGHGVLSILGMFEPIPITDNPGDDDDPGEVCDDVVIIDDDPPIGVPGDGNWYDSRGNKHISSCAVVDEPVDDDPWGWLCV